MRGHQLLDGTPTPVCSYFVTNCGGTLGGTMEFAMHRRESIDHVIDHALGARMARLLAHAPSSNTALRELAEDEARRRFAQVQEAAAQPTLRGRVFGIGLEMHRRGYVPGGLIRRMSRSYFEACAGGLS